MATTPQTPQARNAGLAAKAQYDAVAPGAKKRRREPRIETAPETGKGFSTCRMSW